MSFFLLKQVSEFVEPRLRVHNTAKNKGGRSLLSFK